MNISRVRVAAVTGVAGILLAVPGLAMAAAQVPGEAGAQASTYIVTLVDPGAVGSASDVRASATAADRAKRLGGHVLHVYGHALRGYAAVLPDSSVAELQADPTVASVVQDRTFTISTTQTSPPWGLDRIDQRARPLSGSFTYTATGSGVTAYVIDTGIRFGHTTFGGRAVSGYDAVDGGSATDCHGHGTHVAGTIGGATWGVAKNVSLVGVRVLDCEGFGFLSDIIDGVDWVTRHHTAAQPAVVNMSLGGPPTNSLDLAVRNSINDGITYSVAAGNEGWSACRNSPGRVSEALTVSATDKTDQRPAWANRGSCLDLFAPGVGVKSAWATSNTATKTIGGTSMAAPHVAGVAAQYLQTNPAAAPSTVASALKSGATSGVVKNKGKGSPNLLLHSSY